MMRVLLAALVTFTSFSVGAQSDSVSQQLLTSCTYGVLAGALVGAATLAVEDDPDEKLHRIARGASLGLYTGIFLGLYVAYWLPGKNAETRDSDTSGDDPPEEQENYEEDESGDPLEEYEEGTEEDNAGDYSHLKFIPPPRMIIYPVIENQKITGAAINISVFRF